MIMSKAPSSMTPGDACNASGFGAPRIFESVVPAASHNTMHTTLHTIMPPSFAIPKLSQ